MGANVKPWRGVLLAAAVMAAGMTGGAIVRGDGASPLDGQGKGNAGNVQSGQNTESAAKAAWGKIGNDIKNETDLQTIIGMHDRFLSEYADSTLAETVSSSEDVYKALLKADAKKFRGKWVPAGQIEVIEKTWRDEALQAMAMYQAGNFKEAVEAAKKVEVSDKENGVALAIEGDADYQMKMLPAARGAFEKLLAIDAGNVLAENNLAVIAFDSRQMVAGMVHYSKALGAWGSGAGNVVLVDNVAEALQAYLSGGGTAGSPGNKNNAAYKELVAKAAGPEGEMIAEMEKKGLIRRGAIWVTAAQQEKIMQDVGAVKYQMAILDKQYVDVQQKLKTAQQGLARANAAYQNAMNSLASMDVQMRTANGAYSNYDVGARDRVQNVLAQASQQQEACEREISDLSGSVGDFRKSAEKLKSLLAAADQRYTGVQRIIEPEEGAGEKKGADVLAKASRPAGLGGEAGAIAAAAAGPKSLADAAAEAVKSVTAVVQTDVGPGVAATVSTVTSNEGVVMVQVPQSTGVVYTPPAGMGPGYGPGYGPAVSDSGFMLQDGKLVPKPAPNYGPGTGVVYGPLTEHYTPATTPGYVVPYRPPVTEPLPVYRVPLVPEWVRVNPGSQPTMTPVPFQPQRVTLQQTYWRPEGPWAPALQMQPNFKDDPVLSTPTMTMQSNGLGLVPNTTGASRTSTPQLPGYRLVWVPITSLGNQAGGPQWSAPPSAPIRGTTAGAKR